ncbi:MAG: outer membrane lipoprotein carrier protein LolA [Bacteroidetes bacterium]|nr:outer membrane lipoprotein carrier protein LolA [Bacteroidota bacterium]
MKKFFILFAVLNIAYVAFAQQSDPDAKKILDAVSAKFKTYKTVQAAFMYKVENASGKVLSTKKGSVSMKGNKYRVSIVGQEIFSDGVNVWSYDKSSNEVTITKLDAGSSNITPQKLFTNFYDKDFLYKLNGETRQGGKTIQEIEMTPNDKSRPFHKVYVYVDKGSSSITSTKVLEKTGNKYSYNVTNMKTNTAIPDSQFVFDKSKYPGVEVVDLR